MVQAEVTPEAEAWRGWYPPFPGRVGGSRPAPRPRNLGENPRLPTGPCARASSQDQLTTSPMRATAIHGQGGKSPKRDTPSRGCTAHQRTSASCSQEKER